MLESYQNELQKRWRSKTQQTLAEESGISRSYITKLLSGKAKIDKLSVENFVKLFPDALQSEPQEHLSPSERKLLELFRQLTEEGQLEAIVKLATMLPAAKSTTRIA